MSRILKWAVPIDDEWHQIGAGRVVLVGSSPHPEPPGQFNAYVWTEEPEEGEPMVYRQPREARVYGTGHSFDGWACSHLGSYVAPPFVWHVLGRTVTDEQGADR